MYAWVLAATLVCGASVFTACSDDDDNKDTVINNLGGRLLGKWIMVEENGKALLTNDKYVTTFESETKGYMSHSGDASSGGDDMWASRIPYNVKVAGNKVTLTGSLQGASVVNEMTVKSITDGELTADYSHKLSVNGAEVNTLSFTSRMKKVTVDFSQEVVGLWEGQITSEQSEYDDHLLHRWEYKADGTYVYYRQDAEDKWVASDDEYADYFVDGNLLCTRWKNAGEGQQEKREWWEIQSISDGVMKWTALRQNADGSTYTATFEMKKVNQTNRTAFVEHVRQNLKTLAENLNFYSWISATRINLHINQHILNNPEFEKVLSSAIFQQAYATIKPVEEGSELAAMGFTTYGTIDLTEFNYRFKAKEDFTGFDIEPAEDFEILLNTRNPATQRVDPEVMKLTLKAGGDTSFKMLVASRRHEGLALIVRVPSTFQFALADKFTGTWEDMYSGTFTNKMTPAAGSSYAQLRRDSWSISGEVNSVMALPNVDRAPDATTLKFAVDVDHANGKGGIDLSFVQNNYPMIDLSLAETGPNNFLDFDLSQMNNMSSILDVLTLLWNGRSLDNAKITLLGDLTTTLSISDMQKALKVYTDSRTARRNYADQQTIETYTQQLNDLIQAELTCKGVNQTIPVRLVTSKFGVDWWTMPGLSFADEAGYVPLTELLDQESMEYGVNIIDHAIDPMKESIIVVRQLIQYIQTMFGNYE